MRLASIIDISLVDVPGIPVTVIFTGGCNFDCPYCQNASLIPLSSGNEITISELLSQVDGFLSDGFCITGGEPTLHKDLPDLLQSLRTEIGGHINLNTQGSNPSVLEKTLPFVDSVWFDLKASPKRYRQVCRTKDDPWSRITKSIELIRASDVEFWPRTTYVGGLLDARDIREIVTFLESINFNGEHVIQNYVVSTGVRNSEASHFNSPPIEEMNSILSERSPNFDIRLEWR